MSTAESTWSIIHLFVINTAFVAPINLFWWLISLNLLYFLVEFILCQKQQSSSLYFDEVAYFVAILN